MDAPAHNSTLPPPLPLGWTEHLGPQGQPYYYNSQTQQSTYVRPLPTFAAPPQPQATPAKKEKPVSKTAIPGTGWMRVTTTQGNTFYTHKAKKLSVWVVPDEIKEAVAAVERREGEEKSAVEAVKQEEARRAVEERQREVERIKFELQSGPKRKAADDIPLEEVVVTKKPKVESDEEEDDDEEEDEEEWQKEAAAQLAAEAEEEQRIRDEEAQREKEELEAQKTRQSMPHLEMPERVELSIEEGKALFKTLLREKEINPLHPWDTALPLFISDPRYVLLPSVSARREAFDEYCRDRARELRQSQVKKEKEDPKAEFERLLREEVKSTRTSWTDFRRAWKKDRRFYGWGRDERDREKRFREFLKELGEEKRLAAQRAEEGFFSLLRQSGIATTDALWKEVKHNIVDDPRYDAVGSSSLREELFNTFLKAQSFKTGSPPQGRGEPSSRLQNSDDETDKARKQKEKKERAVKERENRIRVERQRVEESINKSRMTLSREEGELDFKTLLTDAIRDPQVDWETALPQLRTDPRFTNSPLPLNQQLHLFHTHVNQLRAKHLENMHALFQSHAPDLVAPFSALPLPSLLSSLPVTRLGFDVRALKTEYDRWQRERAHDARQAFDEMLRENSFVEFWGKLGKIGGEGVDGGVKRDDTIGEDDGEAGGGNVDMKVLAQSVDLRDMEKVLKNDKRYIVFSHIPEQREQWLRDYLSSLSAPKLSVHLAD